MHRSPDRRTVLRTGIATALALLAGCTGFLSGGGSDNPDAGKDSYGIQLENTMDEKMKVHVKVAKPFGEKSLFDKTVEVGGGKSKEWEEVINEPEEWVVSAELKSGHSAEDLRDDSIYLTPGSDSAPVVENVRIVVEQRSLAGTDVAAVSVSAGQE